MKKTAVSPVPPMPPPATLSPRSQELWRQVVTGRISAGRAELLTEALLCLDRLIQVRGELATAALTTVTERTGAVHINPLVKVECELRRQFSSIWTAMNLHFAPMTDGMNW